MARDSVVSQRIYRKHLRLYRELNDAYIFLQLISPEIERLIANFKGSGHKKKRRYSVPKKKGKIISRRTDADVADMLRTQNERRVYESLIISLVSRFETYIQDCIFDIVKEDRARLTILADEKSGVPLSLLLTRGDLDEIIEEFIRQRCSELMYGAPKAYLEKFKAVAAIPIKDSLIGTYVEIKASRDLIIHNSGVINTVYTNKAGKLARGDIGQELSIDKSYFGDVIVTLKALSGAIIHGVEARYK